MAEMLWGSHCSPGNFMDNGIYMKWTIKNSMSSWIVLDSTHILGFFYRGSHICTLSLSPSMIWSCHRNRRIWSSTKFESTVHNKELYIPAKLHIHVHTWMYTYMYIHLHARTFIYNIKYINIHIYYNILHTHIYIYIQMLLHPGSTVQMSPGSQQGPENRTIFRVGPVGRWKTWQNLADGKRFE